MALPKVGKHRAWIDHVAEGVLCAVINAYRVKGKEDNQFWRVSNKVRKECAIKVGMGSEDGAMEQDDGFGVLV